MSVRSPGRSTADNRRTTSAARGSAPRAWAQPGPAPSLRASTRYWWKPFSPTVTRCSAPPGAGKAGLFGCAITQAAFTASGWCWWSHPVPRRPPPWPSAAATKVSVPRGRKPGVGQVPDGHGHGGHVVQHVQGAAAPHLAVDQVTTERVARPADGVGSDDVGRGVVEQGGCGRVGPLDAGHEGDPSRRRLEALDLDSRSLQDRRHHGGVAHFLPGLETAVVDARVAYEGLQHLGCLVTPPRWVHPRPAYVATRGASA